MSLPTGLRRDSSGTFHLRIGVPEDVQAYWPAQANGKPAVDAYRRSLRTRDRADAITKAHALIAEHQQKFASLRDRHRPRFTQLTPELISHLEGRIKHELLNGDDIRRVFGRALESVPLGLLDDDLSEHLTEAQQLGMWAQVTRDFLAKGEYGLTIYMMNSLLSHMGLPPAVWSLKPVALARLGRVVAATFTAIAERSSGALIETPPAPQPYVPEPPAQPETPKAPALTLRDAVPHWKRLTSAKPNAIQRTEYALSLWEAAVGMVPLDQITRATGGEFVLYLLDDDREFGRKTAKNHADAINALTNKAVQQGLMAANPLMMKFDTEDSQKRTPWTTEQLKTLHERPIAGPQSDEVDAKDADLLVTMLLWSGARIGEIAGLRVQDVQERDGIVAAYIRRETTKNEASVRWLPIATAIRSRVAAHAKLRAEESQHFLFPSFNAREKTSASDHAIKWFREHRNKLKLPEGPLEGSHKWRHTVRTKLGSQGLGEALLDRVTGHKAAGGSAGRKSYDHPNAYPLANVLAAIDSLSWPWPRRA